MDELVILKSKSKLGPLALLAGLFLILGVTMLSTPEQFVGQLWNSLNLIRVLGGLCMVFFWITVFIGVRALTDHTPELTLDSQGFTSRTGFVRNIDKFAGEKILWADLTKLQEFHTEKQKLLEVEFIDQHARTRVSESDGHASDLPEIFSGPPFLLSAKDLSIEFDELIRQFNKYHQAARTKSQLKL